jgi:polyphosphate glucokinase
MPHTVKRTSNSDVETLAIDIGGTGVKMMLLNGKGKPLTDRLRELTPVPATPEAVLALLDQLKQKIPKFDRVSVGFPGVVKQGTTLTAHNLDPKWKGFDLEQQLEQRWGKPVRVCNDAAVQGYGAIKGNGVELVLTFGTGLGSSLFTDGHLCPGLELAHHPWRKGKTYEEYLGKEGLKKYGLKQWNKFVQKVIEQTAKLFNWDYLYIGGGNAEKIDFQLGPNIMIVSNEDGLLGGVMLWELSEE